MNEEHIVRITHIHQVTHDVKCFRVGKPQGYVFEPGQATELSINNPRWDQERRPFTFTGLSEDDYLEFTIKIYLAHNGVTAALDKLVPGDELIIRDVWGAIAYKGEGYFIAGGAGITPFIAIFRQLRKNNMLAGNRLFFSNKTTADIILRDELDAMFNGRVTHVLSNEASEGFHHGHIDKAFLLNQGLDLSKPVYLSGPDQMIADLNAALVAMGAKPDAVVFEK
jgi:ferredoxin-NADP reductase